MDYKSKIMELTQCYRKSLFSLVQRQSEKYRFKAGKFQKMDNGNWVDSNLEQLRLIIQFNNLRPSEPETYLFCGNDDFLVRYLLEDSSFPNFDPLVDYSTGVVVQSCDQSYWIRENPPKDSDSADFYKENPVPYWTHLNDNNYLSFLIQSSMTLSKSVIKDHVKIKNTMRE